MAHTAASTARVRLFSSVVMCRHSNANCRWWATIGEWIL